MESGNCEKAYDHWETNLQRFPGRAHGKQGRKKKGSAGTPSDYYEKLSKTAKASGGGARLIESSDEEEEEEEERDMEEAGAEDASNDEPDYSSVGSYEVQNGWEVLDDPAPTSEEWDAMKETYVWTNKRLVHIWGMPFGWESSTFNHQTTEASSGKLVQFFLYGRERQMYSHDLELEKYGTEGEWVIIQKVRK